MIEPYLSVAILDICLILFTLVISIYRLFKDSYFLSRLVFFSLGIIMLITFSLPFISLMYY
uniref:Uncharacterized protein n=1 Tax=uncultured marine virus TaxID=186617 RepID=A0A0F7L1J1_9VIRU|nr:hypothetical protein [uncultured marine virus]